MVTSRILGVLVSCPFFARICGRRGRTLSLALCPFVTPASSDKDAPSRIISPKSTILDIQLPLVRLYSQPVPGPLGGLLYLQNAGVDFPASPFAVRESRPKMNTVITSACRSQGVRCNPASGEPWCGDRTSSSRNADEGRWLRYGS